MVVLQCFGGMLPDGIRRETTYSGSEVSWPDIGGDGATPEERVNYLLSELKLAPKSMLVLAFVISTQPETVAFFMKIGMPVLDTEGIDYKYKHKMFAFSDSVGKLIKRVQAII